MGGKGSGRPPKAETIVKRTMGIEPKQKIGNDIFLPNLSGVKSHLEDSPIEFRNSISMNSNKITDVTDPSANQDAATKKYVDDNKGADPFDRVSSWQYGGYSAGSSSSDIDWWGVCLEMIEDDNTSTQNEDADGHYFEQTTSTTAGDDARLYLGTSMLRLNYLPHSVQKFKLGQTTDTILFVGLTNTLVADNIEVGTVESVGLWYDSGQHSNFQFAEGDGTTVTATDTGVAADTNAHFIEIEATSGTSVTVSFYDADFTLQKTATLNTTLPSATTVMRFTSMLTNDTTATKSLKQYHGFIALKHKER